MPRKRFVPESFRTARDASARRSRYPAWRGARRSNLSHADRTPQSDGDTRHGRLSGTAAGLTLYDSSSGCSACTCHGSHVFGIPARRIRVIVPFVGGAFGCKGQPWSHVPLAAMAAKLVGRPVKLVATRPQMFGWIGHRPQTEQHVALGARTRRATCERHARRPERNQPLRRVRRTVRDL